MRKILVIVLIFLSLIISVYFIVIKIQANKQFQKPTLNDQISNGFVSYRISQLEYAFDLPSKLSSCGAFTIDFEPGPYTGRTLRSEFSDFTCNYNFFINAYSINDKSGMRTLDIFMNIQGYTMKNNTYSYTRYYDGNINEKPISVKYEPKELVSDYGIKMLRVKGVEQITETEAPLIAGGTVGAIIMTGNSTYPALTLTVDLD